MPPREANQNTGGEKKKEKKASVPAAEDERRNLFCVGAGLFSRAMFLPYEEEKRAKCAEMGK